jgi:hypothetical protein
MIEAFFRRLKHAWLFTKALVNLEAVSRLTEAYLKDHNELIPHYAHAGRPQPRFSSVNSPMRIERRYFKRPTPPRTVALS